MTQTAVLAKNKYLLERLIALRHLPPSTPLPQILIKEDRQLLKELLQLSDEIDVFSWLKDNLDTNVARIALRVVAEQIYSLYRDIQIASLQEVTSDHYHQVLGGLLDLSEEENESLFHELDDLKESNGSEQLLRSFIHRLQLIYQSKSSISSSFRAQDEREQVFINLLQLQEDIDPIDWLKNAYEAFAIRLVLSHLLNRFSVTHGSLTTLPTVRTIKVDKHFRPLSGVDIEIENITLKTCGFLVQAHVNLSPRKLTFSGDTVPSFFTWQGFEKVVDNFGNHYLTWVEKLNSGNTSFNKYREQLTMAFYPALAVSATELTFSSDPMIIETNTISEEQILPLPDVVGNNLLWHVSL